VIKTAQRVRGIEGASPRDEASGSNVLVQEIRKLSANKNAILSEFSFLKAVELLRQPERSYDSYEAVFSLLSQHETSSSTTNVYRLYLLDWINRWRLNNIHSDAVNSAITKFSGEGGVLSSGRVATIRETQTQIAHDLLFPFSFQYSRSRPFFDIRDFGSKTSNAIDKISKLLSQIGAKEFSYNTDYWLGPLAVSIRESYDNIIDHAIIGSSRIFNAETNYEDIFSAQYWTLQFKRYYYDNKNPVFSSLPNFARYHEIVSTQLPRSRHGKFNSYLFVCLMDDGPGIFEYYNKLERINLPPKSLDEIIRNNLSTKKLPNAGGGTIHIYREMVSVGGYVAFFSNNRAAAYHYTGHSGIAGRRLVKSAEIPSIGTLVVMAVPIFR
jgi:hypothetical protein